MNFFEDRSLKLTYFFFSLFLVKRTMDLLEERLKKEKEETETLLKQQTLEYQNKLRELEQTMIKVIYCLIL